MSSKFLPFVTPESTEESVFKAIIQRTKDVHHEKILALFSIVISLGIELVRKKFNSLPEKFTATEKIFELITQNPQYSLPKSELLFWKYVVSLEHHTAKNKSEELNEIMLVALILFKPLAAEKHISKINVEKYKVYSSEEYNPELYKINNFSFSSEYERIGFTCLEELKAYLAFNEESKVPFCFCPVKINSEKMLPEKLDYETNHCISPYH